MNSIDELPCQAIRCFEVDRTADAVRLALQIVRQQADHGPATHLLGVIAHRLGDHDRSERRLRKSLRLGQESPELLEELVRLFAAKEEWDKASSCFERSLHLCLHYVYEFVNLGFVKNAQQGCAAAQDVYRRGIAAFPGNMTLLTNLAVLHRENENLKAAIPLVNEIEDRFGVTASV